MSQPEQEKFLRLKDIIGDHKRGTEGIIPLSRSQWLKGVKAGTYPKPFKIGARAVAWRKSDIDDFIERVNRREI